MINLFTIRLNHKLRELRVLFSQQRVKMPNDDNSPKYPTSFSPPIVNLIFNLDSAVGIVARAIKLMKIHEKVEKFFESSTHPYGEKIFSTFSCRFRRLIARSRFQRRNLG